MRQERVARFANAQMPAPSDLDPGSFLTTRWTRVSLAKIDSAEGREALRELCEAYYEPVLAYLRGVLRDADAAREMSHAFFAAMLQGGSIGAASPQHGRFRFYLLGAVKHFLAHRREAEQRLKRGGGMVIRSLEETSSAMNVAEAQGLSPEAAYDRQWAITVLARAMRSLEEECARKGKGRLLEHLRPSLLGEAEYGDLTAVAAALGVSPDAAKVAASRLRREFRHRLKQASRWREFRQRVKQEIASTLGNAGDVDEEMRSLFAALGG
jgi:RNA polymerase sigma-70 factor (ECF subfamily)